jgi:hypothetical protein
MSDEQKRPRDYLVRGNRPYWGDYFLMISIDTC